MDACRDIPAAWTRSLNRGLAVVGRQPADSIIVYATSVGSVASDGTGRNGLFTTHLLNHLKTPGLEVKDVFNRTGADVARASGNAQRPAIYSQFYNTAYLGSKPTAAVAVTPAVMPAPSPTTERAVASQPAPNTQQTYKIGDTGPAGGIIFYDKGNNKDGWRYLEAAPVDLENASWGLEGADVKGTKTGVGTGKRNTDIIVTVLSKEGVKNRAAQLCRDYSLNGYNDWFLPSKDELNLMYRNLNRRGLGKTINYWSSSQIGKSKAWLQYFENGMQLDNFKNVVYYVRPIRAF